MVIVKVWGGIGNQLFQYIFGQYLHYKYNVDVLYDDNSFISTDKLRKPELSSINANLRYDNSCTFSRYRGIKNRLLRYLWQLCPKHHFISELDGGSIPAVFKPDNIYFMQGYWQDYKYYQWLKDNVKYFDINISNWPQQLVDYYTQITSYENSVSLHVRRGDYFLPKNVGVYGVCDAAYYQKALSSIIECSPNAKIFVFSDDINWVKDNIILPENAIIIDNYDVPQFAYIYLMSLCHHHIISNSSFSWWGAVINENANTLVIAPKKWTLNSDKTIALDNWQKI